MMMNKPHDFTLAHSLNATLVEDSFMPMTFGNIKENDHEMLSKLEESTPKT